MPGISPGSDFDPRVAAAFKAALLHQGLIALLIFAMLAAARAGLRAVLSADRASPGGGGPAPAPDPAPGGWRSRLGSAVLAQQAAAASIRSVAALGGVGLIILGTGPMAVAQASRVQAASSAQVGHGQDHRGWAR
jgi:hypothetical protein